MGHVPNDPFAYYDMGFPLDRPEVPRIKKPVPGWAEGLIEPGPDPTTPQSEQKSARYQEDFQYRQILNSVEGPQWYPLARFRVNRGEIGWIYNIQTQINGWPGGDFRIWYRNADPISWLYEVPGITPQGAPRWRLVLEQRNPSQTRRPRRINAIEPGPLQVHPDLGEWRDGRFVPNGDNYRLKLMIPEGYDARLWLCCPFPIMAETAAPRLVSCRLQGFTQSWADNSEARYNARRAW